MSPSQISATGAEYIKYLPKPINDSLINNFRQTGVSNVNEDRWGGRIDYNLNENNLFHGFFSMGPINTVSYQHHLSTAHFHLWRQCREQ